MKQIQLNSGEFLLVEAPEGVHEYILQQLPDYGFGWLHFLDSKGKEIARREQLIGQWEIIGKGNEIEEEVWRGIVDVFVFVDEESGHYADEYYRNYENVQQIISREYDLEAATDSGLSLIKSHGMKPETTLILKLK